MGITSMADWEWVEKVMNNPEKFKQMSYDKVLQTHCAYLTRKRKKAAMNSVQNFCAPIDFITKAVKASKDRKIINHQREILQSGKQD